MQKRCPFIFSLLLSFSLTAPLLSDDGLDDLYSDQHYVAQKAPPQNPYDSFQLHDREDHILVGIHPTGKRISLEEGSVFDVIPADQEVSKMWRQKDLIRISPSPLSWATYIKDIIWKQKKHRKFTHVILKNMRLGTTAMAEYSSGPEKIDKAQNIKHPYTQFVQHIDVHEGKITLFSRTLQETLWRVAPGDLAILRELKKGDAVIVGVNEEYPYLPWKETYPHVVISYATDNYICVKEVRM